MPIFDFLIGQSYLPSFKIGRYVGAEAQKGDGESVDNKMRRFAKILEERFTRASKLDQPI
jgi:hypothetical protein